MGLSPNHRRAHFGNTPTNCPQSVHPILTLTYGPGHVKSAVGVRVVSIPKVVGFESSGVEGSAAIAHAKNNERGCSNWKIAPS